MNGVINIYKEKGVTSFQVVAKVRKFFGVKKCGHTGTLDPIAEGVLPVCLGFATRFAEYLSSGDKQYIANFKLGKAYDSFDTTGIVIKSSDAVPSLEQISDVLKGFVGFKKLTVPAFSAKKIGGKRAYELARRGELEDAGAASMRIDKIELISYKYPDGVFVVDCGKGTYVRSIVNTLGEITGACAAMSGLVRTKNGAFTLENSHKLADLEKEASPEKFILPVTQVLDFKKTVVKDSAVKKIFHGMPPSNSEYLSMPDFKEGEELLIVDASANCHALRVGRNGKICLVKVFKPARL